MLKDETLLARAYEKKFRAASSATHRWWLQFFDKSLEKQVRAAVCGEDESALLKAQGRYVSLWHAASAAHTLFRAAVQQERKQLLLRLRRNERSSDERSSRRRRTQDSLVDELLWVVSVGSDAIFFTIVSFL